ncbi:GGDEF domain-containing protein [Pseudomonas sp. SA195]
MLGIDHFKRINDRYGHGCGDECLALIGQTLSNFSRRDNEFAARLGGEEFAAVFYGMPPAKAAAIAEQVRESVAKLELQVPDATIRFTISIGVAAWIPAAEDTKLTFAKAADEALYQAKAMGRDHVCLAERAGHANDVLSDDTVQGAR